MAMSRALIEVGVLVAQGPENYPAARVIYEKLYAEQMKVFDKTVLLKNTVAAHLTKATVKAMRQAM